MSDQPTNIVHCGCGTEIPRYRGMGDMRCPQCGSWYNAFGQRLRDDWADNPSNWDNDVDDMEGYEIAALRLDQVLDAAEGVA